MIALSSNFIQWRSCLTRHLSLGNGPAEKFASGDINPLPGLC